MFTILNLLILTKKCIVKCRPTGDPWVPANPMGTGLGTKLNPWWVVGFLTGLYCIRGHEFGQAKPSGFRPVSIPNPTYPVIIYLVKRSDI